ncbi:MAG: PIG-L family deacetylase [Bacteroidia bacterium]|nr:PIG-L family deacetylase [Bacteroidia bacterium]
MNNILILAPHADDEILGCGGTIAKKIKEGHQVWVGVLTNANITDPAKYTIEKLQNIRAEAQSAANLLGVKEVLFGEVPAITLDQYPAYKVTEVISNWISKFQIDTIYLPHRGDIHNDHKVIFDAGLVASRPVGKYFVHSIFAYETLSETEWAHPFSNDAFIPNYFEVLSLEDFKLKLDAMSCYKSQVRQFPNSRSLETIESLAKYRGSTVSAERAEAFMIIRTINK